MQYTIYNTQAGKKAKVQVYATCNGLEGFGSGINLIEAQIKATANLLDKMAKQKINQLNRKATLQPQI